jgi:cyclic-di-GMP phosphodiesterase TipF (flagellum assembly factor)
MVLIAGSLGVVLYLRFGLTGAESALVALGVLTALAVYNTISARTRDRAEVSNQFATLARGSGDLARQLAEFSRRLTAMDAKVEAVLDRALATAQPLAAEIEELSRLVKQLADQVAVHDVALTAAGNRDRDFVRAEAPAPAPVSPVSPVPAFSAAPPDQIPLPSAPPVRNVAAFKGIDNDGIVAVVRSAIDANRIDLYLQPIVTLPQRKVRYYEAMSRLKTEAGQVVAAADFLSFAEAGSLMPKLDNLAVLRCVQVVRRLLRKNRDIGLFCNVSGATLTDGGFPQFLEFMEANRAIASSLVFEFTQAAVRAMGPIEHESLAALAERGFRFSLDNLADLRVEPRELNDRGFRYIKVPATLLLNRVGAASTDIHPADFSDLLGRFGIDLIAERIERESTVVDLLDYDVRFGQGFLFSPPRPVRAEALQGLAGDGADGETATTAAAKAEPGAAAKTDPAEQGKRGAASSRIGSLASLARTGSGHT